MRLSTAEQVTKGKPEPWKQVGVLESLIQPQAADGLARFMQLGALANWINNPNSCDA